MARFWLGPLEWDTRGAEPCWRAPAGVVGFIDLRSHHQCSLSGGVPEGVGVLVTANAANLGADYRNFGTDPQAVLSGVQRAAWKSLTALPNDLAPAASVESALREVLCVQADPLEERCAPLLPTAQRRHETWLAGVKMYDELFTRDTPGAAQVQELLRRKYRILRQRCLDDELPRDLYLKVLDGWVAAYGIDYRWFQPQDLPDERPKQRETTYTDDFTRADNPSSLGTSAGGQTWVTFNGTQGISTNRASSDSGVSGESRIGANLSSADHYAQVDVLSVGGSGCGALTRKDTSATRTHYNSVINTGNQQELRKRNSATLTVLRTDSPAHSLPDTVRQSCSGSTIEHFLNGVSLGTSTDTSITGNLQAGMNGGFGTNLLDNFECADLAAGASTRGMPFGARSTAFNGGRCLVGNIR